MSQESPLCRIRYRSEPDRREAEEHAVVRIVYGAETAATDAELRVAMPPVGRSALCEHWCSERLERRGAAHGFRFACFGPLMLAYAVFREAGEGLRTLTHEIYRGLLALGQAQGYPWILRIWNHFPAIGAMEDGMSRYRQFCEGRRQALHGDARSLAAPLPAVTTTGSQAPGFAIYFLAGREAGRSLDNPRQTAPSDYPQHLGPHGPSFCRGVAAHPETGGPLLCLSGTASIAGHETLHPGDAARQAREALRNQALVMAQAHREDPAVPGQLGALPFEKVYVAAPEHLPAVRAELDAALGAARPCYFLHSALCREDLMLEMESTCLP